MIDYSPLWETMKQKGITQYMLIQNGLDNRSCVNYWIAHQMILSALQSKIFAGLLGSSSPAIYFGTLCPKLAGHSTTISDSFTSRSDSGSHRAA